MTQKYISSKIVTAWEAEKDGEPGYAVKYQDGYTSWSPKAIFESSHVAMGHTDTLPGWQERIVGEYVQLQDRIKKLSAYLETKPEIPEVAVDLLEEQLDHMLKYLEVLHLRLAVHGVLQVWTEPKS